MEQLSQRRLTENEAVFRQLNEQFLQGIIDTDALALETGQSEYLIAPVLDNQLLRFFCECADETCTQRVKLTLYVYGSLHLSRNRFVVLPGHEVLAIERVVARHEPDYLVVEKLLPPSSVPPRPHRTGLRDV